MVALKEDEIYIIYYFEVLFFIYRYYTIILL